MSVAEAAGIGVAGTILAALIGWAVIASIRANIAITRLARSLEQLKYDAAPAVARLASAGASAWPDIRDSLKIATAILRLQAAQAGQKKSPIADFLGSALNAAKQSSPNAPDRKPESPPLYDGLSA